MSFDSQKSRQTGAEIVSRVPVAASASSPIASSPAPACATNQAVVCRGETAAQTSRSVRPIPAAVLHSIFERRPNLYHIKAANDLAYAETERRATGGKIGVAIMVMAAVFIGLLLATGGAL